MEKMTREEAINLSKDPLWKKLRVELDTQITSSTEKLIFCEDMNDVIRLQEKIKALRLCTRLPDIVAEREE